MRAHAQITTSSLFVEGAVFGDRDGSRSVTPPMTTGVASTIGFRLNRSWSVRFDVEVPADHSLPTYASFFPGRYRVEEMTSVRTITYDATLAWHAQARSNVDIALMAGLGTAVSQTSTAGFSDTLSQDGSIARHVDLNRHSSYNNGSLTFGTDVAVQLTPHIAIVPELRIHLFSEYGSVVRPKLALRWTF